jgi:hypothetical protein
MIIQVNGIVDNPYNFIGFQVLAGGPELKKGGFSKKPPGK